MNHDRYERLRLHDSYTIVHSMNISIKVSVNFCDRSVKRQFYFIYYVIRVDMRRLVKRYLCF